MSKYLGFGYYNSNYKYIILYIFFRLFNNSLSGINYYSAFVSIKLFSTDTQNKFSNHGLVHLIFNHFGTFILSIIFSRYENRIYIGDPKYEEEQKILIEAGNKETKTSFSYFLFIIFLWILTEFLLDKYGSTLCHLDFWMIELIIISYLSSKIIKTEIYDHQKLVLFLNLFPIFLKIITIILSFIEKQKIIYVEYLYFIPIGLLIYFPLITLKSYIYIKIKWYMKTKYISSNKLLKIYGLIGTIFYTIICTISTFFECKGNILNYICKIKKDDDSKDQYFENLSFYFQNFNETIEIIFEIIVIILGIISFYFYQYCCMKIVDNLTPIHLTFLSPIYYFFFKIVLIIYNLFYLLFNQGEQIFFAPKEIKHIKEIVALDISGDIFSLVGFLIFLEIIEIKCCGFTYNLRKNIIDRGNEEILEMIENKYNRNDSFGEVDNNEIISRVISDEFSQ